MTHQETGKLLHDPDLEASAGTLYWLAHDDHLGETVGRRASPSEIIEAARNLPGAEELMEVTEKNAPVLIDGRYLKSGRYLVIPIEAIADARRTEEETRPGWQPTDEVIERDYDEILGRTDPPTEEE